MSSQSPPDAIAQLAGAYARAVERGDWAVARRALAPSCTREGGGRSLAGAEAIVADLATHAAQLQQRFDEVRRDSEVEPIAPGIASVRFTEYLIKAPGLPHRHRWREEVHADATPAIVRIVRHDLPGEAESLAAFLKRCGF